MKHIWTLEYWIIDEWLPGITCFATKAAAKEARKEHRRLDPGVKCRIIKWVRG